MRIIIIGAGQVGSFIARELSDQYDVVMIEKKGRIRYLDCPLKIIRKRIAKIKRMSGSFLM